MEARLLGVREGAGGEDTEGPSVDFSFEKNSGKGRKERRRYFEGGPGKTGSKIVFSQSWRSGVGS